MLTYTVPLYLTCFYCLALIHMCHVHETLILQSFSTGKPIPFVTVDPTPSFSRSHTSFGPSALSFLSFTVLRGISSMPYLNFKTKHCTSSFVPSVKIKQAAINNFHFGRQGVSTCWKKELKIPVSSTYQLWQQTSDLIRLSFPPYYWHKNKQTNKHTMLQWGLHRMAPATVSENTRHRL